MGRYEFLLQKPLEEVIDMSSNGGQGVFVFEEESPTEFLSRNLRGKILTKNELHDNLVSYYSRYSEKDRLNFHISFSEDDEDIGIEPGNEYTDEVMRKVRHVFKDKRA
jgi:hypothetical protein